MLVPAILYGDEIRDKIARYVYSDDSSITADIWEALCQQSVMTMTAVVINMQSLITTN